MQAFSFSMVPIYQSSLHSPGRTTSAAASFSLYGGGFLTTSVCKRSCSFATRRCSASLFSEQSFAAKRKSKGKPWQQWKKGGGSDNKDSGKGNNNNGSHQHKQASMDGLSGSQDNQRLGTSSSEFSEFSPQRLQGAQRSLKTHVATAEGGSNSSAKLDLEIFQGKSLNLWQTIPAPVRDFPWDKAYARLVHRLLDLFLKVGKWLVIPLLIVSSLSEMAYTLSVHKELFIPFGLFAGSTLAGILKETALAVSEDFQGGEISWHLVVIGAFFALIKIPGPSYPGWASAFLPHFANGGLWQTVRFSIEWQKSRAGMSATEEISSESNKKPSGPNTRNWRSILCERVTSITQGNSSQVPRRSQR